MLIKRGRYRIVFISSKFVLKLPRNFTGILVNLNEYYNYIQYRDLRTIIARTYVSVFGLLNIMEKANTTIINDQQLDTFIRLVSYNMPHPLLDDLHFNNLGIINDKIIKLDYGNHYWLYNFMLDIKNKLNDWRE